MLTGDLMEDEKYILLDTETLGKFTTLCRYEYAQAKALVPAFYIERVPQISVSYIPGQLDGGENFYPGAISYVLITYLTFKLMPVGSQLEASLTLHSADYERSRIFTISATFCQSEQDYSLPPFRKIFPVIDTLNRFVHAGNDIGKITNLSFQRRGRTDTSIISVIDNLNLAFLDKSSSPRGKDVLNWREISVTNLPKSAYVRSIFLTMLSGAFNWCREESIDLMIIHDTRDGQDDEKTTMELKDRLKFYFYSCFDQEIADFEYLVDQTHQSFRSAPLLGLPPTLAEISAKKRFVGYALSE